MKQCSVCREVLPLVSFHRHSMTQDGYHTQCKTCRRRAAQRTVGFASSGEGEPVAVWRGPVGVLRLPKGVRL